MGSHSFLHHALSFLLLLQWPSTSHAVGASASEKNSLYRFDTRSPDQMTKEGGFRPWGADVSVPGYSLYEQVNEAPMTVYSMYTSTSTDPQAAIKFGNSFSGGKRGYLYEVKPSGNAIDVAKSLGQFYPKQHRWQKEVAFLGGIRREQIKSTAEVPGGFQGSATELPWKPYGHYDKKFEHQHAIAAPQLAGFPEDSRYGPRALKVEPWKSFNQDPTEYAKAIMDRTGKEMGWAMITQTAGNGGSGDGGLFCKRNGHCRTKDASKNPSTTRGGEVADKSRQTEGKPVGKDAPEMNIDLPVQETPAPAEIDAVAAEVVGEIAKVTGEEDQVEGGDERKPSIVNSQTPRGTLSPNLLTIPEPLPGAMAGRSTGGPGQGSCLGKFSRS
ncbi:hypothetical protein RJ55_04016 [Drechmeria coniospora]|nr:hypothetical protein RJ55_04016 [Drechmeria coniospora]